ncbi:MAG: tRNA (adenosine(37)-N6)-threonylcarbamoyltransferase complex ATPase subunit type 1 TsaE [Aquificaceae bacterium]
MRVFSSSEEETFKIGELIGRNLRGAEVICLIGPLGAGKTTLIRGIAKGMGLLQGYQVRSPTFTLINEYPTEKGLLIHADLYRVKELDLEEFVGRGVLVVEWGEGLRVCTCTIRIEIWQEGRVLDFSECEELATALSYGKAC